MKRVMSMVIVFVLGIAFGIIFNNIYYNKVLLNNEEYSSKTDTVEYEINSPSPTLIPTDTPTPLPSPTFNPELECQSDNNKEKLKEILTGKFLCDAPALAAGMGEYYLFYSDGTFEYKTSQFDGERRLISFSGKWDIVCKNLLHLIITNKTVLEGGYFEKGYPSGLTDYILRGAEIKEIELDPPEEIIYPLRELSIDKQQQHPLMMKIGGKQYWQWGSTGDEPIEGVLEERN